jgi:light-regulated signal transduction histidine kinase (bacteriophytochrome)
MCCDDGRDVAPTGRSRQFRAEPIHVPGAIQPQGFLVAVTEPDLVVGRPLIATVYRSRPYLVIEAEGHGIEDLHSPMIAREAAMALQAGRSVSDFADAAARWTGPLSGFDRVMVDRFDEDWNGEVIAERKLDDLNTFLGSHYPASDIPAQARELHRRNWL